MLAEFRQRYPKGSLTSELVQIDHGQYIVRVSVQVEGNTLATALSSSNKIEEAEDRAMTRALALLCLNNTASVSLPPEEKPKTAKSPAPENSFKSTKPAQEKVTSSNNGAAKLPLEIVNNQSALELASSNNGATKVPLEIVNNQSSLELASPPLQSLTTVEPTSASIKDNSEMIALISMELKRIGWKDAQGRDYLLTTYGKKSRHMLSNEELVDFLEHLQQQPSS